MRPDDDLGKSNRHGFRNIVKEGDENRMFGVPTIRYDIKKPARVSVADPNVIFFILRTTLTKLQLSNYCSHKTLHHMEWMIKTSKNPDQKNKFFKYSLTLALISNTTFLMLSFKNLKPSKELFWTKSVVILLKKPSSKWPIDNPITCICHLYCPIFLFIQ